jgi:hypothetical protein
MRQPRRSLQCGPDDNSKSRVDIDGGGALFECGHVAVQRRSGDA